MSDASKKFRGGRVIMGMQSRALDELNSEARNAVRLATPETEEKFLERVREKARAKAAEVINSAMAEARVIREKASKEGRKQGLSKADEEIAAMKDQLKSDVAQIFSNLKKEKIKIWDEYRLDMVMVLKASVDKVLGIEMSENRTKILESLLNQSLELVESSKEMTITVCQEDEQTVRDLLQKAEEKYPEMGTCRVKSSKKIKKGGLILENGSGVVDNTLESRYNEIKKIVEQLSLSQEES
ncbi:MAG: FliH/SctL family protein [Desulfonatronovibrio sp.]